MKIIYHLFLIVTLLAPLTYSCASKSGSNENGRYDLNGRWILYKETKNGKSKAYDSSPVAMKFEFKENGYFVMYDEITDTKIVSAGVETIHDKLKGQFQLEADQLRLNHYIGDSLATRIFKVESLNSKKLILFDKMLNKTLYYRHQNQPMKYDH